MTIKDVAELAGVSPSTVSRVVNKGDEKSASTVTQRKIWDAVNTLRYTPNIHARSLKSNMAEGPELLKEIAGVYGSTGDSLINPFFNTLLHEVEKTAYEKGYYLRFSFSEIHAHLHNKDNSANSVIILGKTDSKTLNILKNHYKHIIYTGLQDLALNIDQVISSGYQAAQSAIHYLLELGHQKICYIGETTNEQRFLAYQDTMREAGLIISEQDTASTDLSPGQGYEAVQRLLNKNTEFTAIFCSNDILAIGALKALKDNKIKVPDEVSLISIDDIDTAGYLSPMLTTVRIPIKEMGSMAVKILIDRMEGGHKTPLKVNIPNSLIYRNSCSKCAKIYDKTKRNRKGDT